MVKHNRIFNFSLKENVKFWKTRKKTKLQCGQPSKQATINEQSVNQSIIWLISNNQSNRNTSYREKLFRTRLYYIT